MACGCDEVQQNMYTVVAEARVTLDTRLLCKNAIVLALKISDDLLETGALSAKVTVLARG
jgi:hypothetical protein